MDEQYKLNLEETLRTLQIQQQKIRDLEKEVARLSDAVEDLEKRLDDIENWHEVDLPTMVAEDLVELGRDGVETEPLLDLSALPEKSVAPSIMTLTVDLSQNKKN